MDIGFFHTVASAAERHFSGFISVRAGKRFKQASRYDNDDHG